MFGIRINVFTAAIVFLCAVAYIVVATKGRETPDEVYRAGARPAVAGSDADTPAEEASDHHRVEDETADEQQADDTTADEKPEADTSTDGTSVDATAENAAGEKSTDASDDDTDTAARPST